MARGGTATRPDYRVRLQSWQIESSGSCDSGRRLVGYEVLGLLAMELATLGMVAQNAYGPSAIALTAKEVYS